MTQQAIDKNLYSSIIQPVIAVAAMRHPRYRKQAFYCTIIPVSAKKYYLP